MCGVPFHAVEHYVNKLIRAGKRVAICDQKGEVLPGKLVEREITQILSAGTVTDPRMLDARSNHYLAAAAFHKGVYGFATLDLTTGDFRVTDLPGASALLDELGRVAPAEFLVSDDPAQAAAFAGLADTKPYDSHAFLFEQADFTLREHFGVQSLDGFGAGGMTPAVSAAGAIFHYLQHQMRRPIGSRHPADDLSPGGFPGARHRLASASGDRQGAHHRGDEPAASARPDRDAAGRAPAAGNGSCTPCAPSNRCWRASGLSRTCSKLRTACGNCAKTLREVRDLERALGRLSQTSGNARDLHALAESLAAVPALKRIVRGLPAGAAAAEPRDPHGAPGPEAVPPGGTHRAPASRGGRRTSRHHPGWGHVPRRLPP